MDLGSFLLIFALLILVGLFISRPFLERKPLTADVRDRALSDRDDHELSSLLAERDRILNALQELDFDHTLGKIPDEDYPAQRAVLLQRGADVLRQLDTFQSGTPENDVEARIEAAIAARRADARLASAAPKEQRERVEQIAQIATPDDALEVRLANRRRERQGKAAGFCPQCGGPVQKTDRFCPKCGTTLA